jgi:hypothetical protein
MEKNPYLILEVPRHATRKEIAEAYRRLARQYHPDVNKSPAAASRMREINWAYEVLCDPVKRASINKKHKAYRAQWEKRYWQDTHSNARARAYTRARHWSCRPNGKPWSRSRQKSSIRNEMEQGIAYKVTLGVIAGIASWILLIFLSDVFTYLGGILSIVVACYVASDTDLRASSQSGSLIGAIFGFLSFVIVGLIGEMADFGVCGFSILAIGSVVVGVSVGSSLGSATGKLASKIRRRSLEKP